jgi:hypothetical protein
MVWRGETSMGSKKHTSLQTVRLDTIQRQNPEAVVSREKKTFVRKYRSAVKAWGKEN